MSAHTTIVPGRGLFTSSGVDERMGLVYCATCAPVSDDVTMVDITHSAESGTSTMDMDPEDVACERCGKHPRDWPRHERAVEALVEVVRCRIF